MRMKIHWRILIYGKQITHAAILILTFFNNLWFLTEWNRGRMESEGSDISIIFNVIIPSI